METIIERFIYASRWILAPIYLGLSLALLALGLKFFQEIFHVLPVIFAMKEADLVLVVLSLIDLALVGGLIVMVMLLRGTLTHPSGALRAGIVSWRGGVRGEWPQPFTRTPTTLGGDSGAPFGARRRARILRCAA